MTELLQFFWHYQTNKLGCGKSPTNITLLRCVIMHNLVALNQMVWGGTNVCQIFDPQEGSSIGLRVLKINRLHSSPNDIHDHFRPGISYQKSAHYFSSYHACIWNHTHICHVKCTVSHSRFEMTTYFKSPFLICLFIIQLLWGSHAEQWSLTRDNARC